MSQAAIALIGVVIGGLLTGGVDFVLERRREKRSGTAAARLVHSSLTDVDSFIKASLVRRAWLGDPSEVLSERSWLDHSASLAAAPGFVGWYPVAGAWAWISQLRRLVELFEEQVADDPMENRDRDFFELGLMLLGIADQALLDYAKTKSYKDPEDAGSSEFQQELDAIFSHALKDESK